MKQHLGRQSGVQNVEVSLIDGKVEVTPKEDGQIDPAQLLKATYDSGVTVAEMDMTAQGKVVKESAGNLALQVEPNRTFALAPNELRRDLSPLPILRPWSRFADSCTRSPQKKESGRIGSTEAADFGNTEEGIDAEKTPVDSDFRCV